MLHGRGHRRGGAGALAETAADLFVTGLEAPDGDPLDLFWHALTGPNAVRHSLVVTRHGEPWPLLALRGLPMGGAVDTGCDAPDTIETALRALAEGRRYWSPALQARFAGPDVAMQRVKMLAPTERLVLALIASGLDPKATGVLLGLRTASVESVVKQLHRTLGVGHNPDLVGVAVRLGFVRHASAGPIRVGFGLLLADYYARGKRPCAPTPELCAAYPEATALAFFRLQGRLRARAA